MYNSIPSKYSFILVFLLLSIYGFAADVRIKLTGVVTDEAGKAISGITVVLQPDNKRAVTDGNGKFSIKNLYGGTYNLTIKAIGFEKYATEVKIEEGKIQHVIIKLKQGDHALNEVNVSGVHSNPDNFIDMTRTAMPSKVISRKEIEMMGSRRLDEVLKEQTGLAIVSDIGAGSRAVGLQMQGFGSGYTMIMIDGQPMVGRNGGNFDLSRITVSSIERIEIIKGASSCLFGSEALAGVINIVTRKNITHPQGMAGLTYGSFNMLDATLEGETPFAGKKGSAYFSGNYYRTDGFNANPYLNEGKTAPPFNSFAFQGRGRYLLSDKSTLNFNGRYVTRYSENELSYGVKPSKDILDEHDLNGSIALNNNFNNGLKLKTQYYLTRYQTAQDITDLNSGVVIPGNRFEQYLHRAELQVTQRFSNVIELTGGTGAAYELLDNTAYRGSKNMANYFGYAQASWQAADQLSVTAGARYDYHDRYGAKLNPSLGLQYNLNEKLRLKAAVGTGFKTPNFQQLYLVFTNLQTGYTVLGSEEFGRELKLLQDAGQIMSVLPIAKNIGSLRPERSVSYSAGFNYNLFTSLKLDVNVFYNDMKDFINSELVAVKTNNQQIFSYINIARAYTTGTEIGLSWSATKSLNLSAGYQLLYAIDKGVVDSIKNGTGLYGSIYDTDINDVRPATRKDYVGLNNRSRHMANLKISYAHEKSGITGTFRVNYRSKYGFMEDNKANNFLDPYDTYVRSFFLLNAAVQKTFYNKHLQLQLTADNLMNYRDQLMPAQQGRAIVAGISWRFFKD
ncbi:outer membrane receptor for ferrienterochelin and colicins [Pedobacter sp. ok626]|uniref:TonB-dependent receptor n=1 Tax=Pedobacter sp. ok626 TaxID=1761882 RepID=UPI00087F2AAE|nr:TonB-dependent receptor [Pedobacter sp. ok626]SDL00895.1 outer membrane receptor for ferrienterochelin and colicins [Pedobacter sp. ok626]